jgi:hypothetical protein
MEAQIVYHIQQTDFESVLSKKLSELQKEAAYSRFRGTLVSPDVVAAIHNVHRDTVIKYSKFNLLPHQKKGTHYKYDLKEALQFDFHELKKEGKTI